MTKEIPEVSGIYAITVDGIVVYVGQSRNMRRRAQEHQAHINKPNERKYYYLNKCWKNGAHIEFRILRSRVPLNQLTEAEIAAWEEYRPILNAVKPGHIPEWVDNRYTCSRDADYYK